jgi:hypothetical protein
MWDSTRLIFDTDSSNAVVGDGDSTLDRVLDTVPYEPEAHALDGLRDAYRQQGYDDGYRRANRDATALLALAVEEFSRSRALEPRHRALLRDFQRYAERSLDAATPAFTYVEEGLGI